MLKPHRALHHIQLKHHVSAAQEGPSGQRLGCEDYTAASLGFRQLKETERQINQV